MPDAAAAPARDAGWHACDQAAADHADASVTAAMGEILHLDQFYNYMDSSKDVKKAVERPGPSITRWLNGETRQLGDSAIMFHISSIK